MKNALTALILAVSAAPAWAGLDKSGTWAPETLAMAVLSTGVFGLLGILLAITGFKLFDRLTPFDLEKEICEKQNMAVGVLCGGMMLGLCIIVAAAVL